MESLILICLSILIICVIFGVISILLGSKCTPGDTLCDNNIASYKNNIYNNKWLNNNSYIKEYPYDTSRYFMLRGKKDFSTLPETSTYQPIIDSIDNCANYLSLQTDDNNYFIESNGSNSNNLTCNIKHIDYDSDIRGNKINNNNDMITIINGVNSNDTYFYKGMIDYSLLTNNGDICINNYNRCMRDINTGKCNDYKIDRITPQACTLDNTKPNAASDLCNRYACYKNYGDDSSIEYNKCINVNNNMPCGNFVKDDKYTTKDVVACAQRMKDKNMDMATFNKAAPPNTNNCYYRNFPSGNPYNYLIFRK
ncbi:MAG: hypothetical protein LWX54_03170 [Deltaproteobacteria bacterium]|jgi:hypothetical protein|nr:hypothetical protein [Deltaproteobacteria bacterium]